MTTLYPISQKIGPAINRSRSTSSATETKKLEYFRQNRLPDFPKSQFQLHDMYCMTNLGEFLCFSNQNVISSSISGFASRRLGKKCRFHVDYAGNKTVYSVANVSNLIIKTKFIKMLSVTLTRRGILIFAESF